MQKSSRLRVSLAIGAATMIGAGALLPSTTTSASPEDDLSGYVGPLRAIRADAELLKAPARGRGRTSERAFLGVTPTRSRDGGGGVQIEQLHQGSSAEKAGLQRGDRIVELGFRH